MSPGQKDEQILRRHLAALDAAVAQLRKHAGKPRDVLLASLDERWAVERGLQVCAQSCIDIAAHLAASAGHNVVDYASAIDALVPMGVLDPGFANRFRAIAGFRNILVHGYLAVDVPRLHETLNTRLDDFAIFAEQVRSRA